jgi:hypothetical protein
MDRSDRNVIAKGKMKRTIEKWIGNLNTVAAMEIAIEI